MISIFHWNMGYFLHGSLPISGKNITTSLFSRSRESWFILGKSSPFMAQQFRLVKCYHLPSNMYLVGGLEHEFYFPFHIWDVILPIDELIFFRRVETTNQIWLDKVDYYVPRYYKPIINPYINGIMWYNFNLWLIMLTNVVKTMS